MMRFRLSSRLMTRIFWEGVLCADDERHQQRDALIERLSGLESLRESARYNTGSISMASAWCLYSLARYFRPTRVIEVGTFIGKSTVSIATGMDHAGRDGEIFTCDMSNDLRIPYEGRCRIQQFPNTGSTEMLRALDGAFDLLFLDGRLQPEDLTLLAPLLTPQSIIVLDDFEGAEKGVANLMLLSRLASMKGYMPIYPAPEAVISSRGFTNASSVAVLLPLSLLEFTRQ